MEIPGDDAAGVLDDLIYSSDGEIINIPKSKELSYSKTVENHMYDLVKKGTYKGDYSRAYTNSNGTNLLIDEIMQEIPTKDAYLNNALRWDVQGSYRDSQGVWELVLDLDTNTIVHFNFVK